MKYRWNEWRPYDLFGALEFDSMQIRSKPGGYGVEWRPAMLPDPFSVRLYPRRNQRWWQRG